MTLRNCGKNINSFANPEVRNFDIGERGQGPRLGELLKLEQLKLPRKHCSGTVSFPTFKMSF